jgi:hypothetical protein
MHSMRRNQPLAGERPPPSCARPLRIGSVGAAHCPRSGVRTSAGAQCAWLRETGRGCLHVMRHRSQSAHRAYPPSCGSLLLDASEGSIRDGRTRALGHTRRRYMGPHALAVGTARTFLRDRQPAAPLYSRWLFHMAVDTKRPGSTRYSAGRPAQQALWSDGLVG